MSQSELYFVYLDREHRYAVPMSAVVEIIDAPEPKPFHASMVGCLGAIIYRGELIPVFDSTTLSGGSDTSAPQANSIILVRDSNVYFALSMERHLAVTRLAAGEHSEKYDEKLDRRGQGLLEAALAHEDELLLVLSVSRIAALVQTALGNLRALTQEDREDEAIVVSDEERSESDRYLCATVDHVRLALPINRITEIVEGCDVTPLFHVSASVRGLINLRGQVIACFDLSQDFSLPPRILEERSSFVILDGSGRELALCVDKILGIRSIEPDRLHNTDTILRGEFVRYVQSILEEEGGTLLFISVPEVFESPHLQAHQRLQG